MMKSIKLSALRSLIREAILTEAPPKKPVPKKPAAKSKAPKRPIVPMQWNAWNKRNPMKWEPTQTGTGPGEAMLAWELGGETQGGNVSYDVVTADGKKWEVKFPDPNNNTIRAGQEGQGAFAAASKELIAVMDQLVTGFASLTDKNTSGAIAALLGPKGAEQVQQIKMFVDTAAPLMTKGEISFGRIFGGTSANPVGLKQAMEFIHMLMTSHGAKPGKETTKNVTYADKKRDVDIPTYIKVGKTLDVPSDEIDVDVTDLFFGSFTHPGFKDPAKFISNNWTNGAPASAVFGKTDGVILVDQSKGYFIIPTKKLDKTLTLIQVTQGNRPKYRVNVG